MNKILHIEPDKRVASLYKSAIEAKIASTKVFIVHDAQTALYEIETVKPDIILLELDLPDHSGFEFLYEFVSYDDWQNIPICILSRLPESYYNKMSLEWSDVGVKSYWYKAETSLHELQQLLQAQLAQLATT